MLATNACLSLHARLATLGGQLRTLKPLAPVRLFRLSAHNLCLAAERTDKGGIMKGIDVVAMIALAAGNAACTTTGNASGEPR